mmetsp:Transcript_12502/g.37562  ORF Transcript_12502/g.37562 Transcript_12502/m.37562 type:complete len:347 (+) Transcript_12502:1739-2779(+)
MSTCMGSPFSLIFTFNDDWKPRSMASPTPSCASRRRASATCTTAAGDPGDAAPRCARKRVSPPRPPFMPPPLACGVCLRLRSTVARSAAPPSSSFRVVAFCGSMPRVTLAQCLQSASMFGTRLAISVSTNCGPPCMTLSSSSSVLTATTSFFCSGRSPMKVKSTGSGSSSSQMAMTMRRMYFGFGGPGLMLVALIVQRCRSLSPPSKPRTPVCTDSLTNDMRRSSPQGRAPPPLALLALSMRERRACVNAAAFCAWTSERERCCKPMSEIPSTLRFRGRDDALKRSGLSNVEARRLSPRKSAPLLGLRMGLPARGSLPAPPAPSTAPRSVKRASHLSTSDIDRCHE